MATLGSVEDCIHGTNPEWCAICTRVEAGPDTSRGGAAKSQGRTKQAIANDICRALGIQPLELGRGSSVPSEIFEEVARQFGVPFGQMPAVGRDVATKAGLAWGPDCDSTGTPSQGGSTVTGQGLEVVLAAVRRLSESGSETFDRELLHEYLAVIPVGRWTNYGEVSVLVGTGPRGLGSHVRSCPECPNAWRVLEERGLPSPHFVWSNPAETRRPIEVLESEGLNFRAGLADPRAFVRARDLRALRADAFHFPTIEWVKDPVELASGLPNGRRMQARHFSDCDHWFRADDGSLIGEPPLRATDAQMRSLPACKDCEYDARRSGNPIFGPRLAAVVAPDPWPAVAEDLPASDVFATTLRRQEQSFLRATLLGGRASAPCDVCGRLLPSSLLVAAHIVPRSLLTEPERYDFNANAMLACLLGCDALFERGLLIVDDWGRILVSSDPGLADVLQPYLGVELPGFSEARSRAFRKHRSLHEGAPT